MGYLGTQGSYTHDSWHKRLTPASESPTEAPLEIEGSGLVPRRTKHIKFTTDRYKIRINKMADPIDSAL